MLNKLMSPFTVIMRRTVGDYKNMEVEFKMDKYKTPYHANPYIILVAQINLMKPVITKMVKNKVLNEYNGNNL